MKSLLRTQQLSEELYALFDGRRTPSTTRELLAAAAHDAVHEHHRAIAHLVALGLNGSAFALLRVMFDGCVRGLWITHVATDNELERFTDERYDPKPERVLRVLETRDIEGSDQLRRIYTEGWNAMSSYVHGSLRQVVGRIGAGFIGANYPPEEVEVLLTNANWFALLAAVELAGISGDEKLFVFLLSAGERYASAQA